MADEVGSFAEEAARLADAVQGWARGEGAGRASAAAGHMATGDAACCVCPLCSVIVLLRGERPELTSKLMESVAGLVVAGQGLLDTLSVVAAESRSAASEPDTHPESAAPGNDRSGGAAPRVQNIPLD